jgi:Ca-activated chloride channel family protein
VVPEEERLPANLVFLIDVSGSMQDSNKLGLVQFTLKSLVERLQPTDTLGIVVYAGYEAVLLEPTAIEDKSAILDVIDGLAAGGSTAGEAGLRAAYDLAEGAFRPEGINRVVLCTDGDFNVGATGEELLGMIEDFRDRDIFLTALGYGMGNYNDATMEQLADRGNGNYAYIDSANEATRMVGEQLVGALQVIAKDVKVQVEFDPAAVSRFRLIGYENRVLEHDEFADDAVDAGDIGAGHDVTALYEVELSGNVTAQNVVETTPIATVRLRHKEPQSDISTEREFPLTLAERRGSFEALSARTRFAAAVTELAEILRGSSHSEGRRFEDVRAILEETQVQGRDVEAELIELVDIASAL